MEQMKLATIADLMSKQSGEDVDAESIITLPSKTTSNMSAEDYDTYVARTKSFTCLAHIYADGRVHIYVH